MWLVLQPIPMIGMLANDNVLTAAVADWQLGSRTGCFLKLMNVRDWFCPRDDCTKAFRRNANDAVRSPQSISRRDDRT